MTIINIYDLLECIDDEFKIIDSNYNLFRFGILTSLKELNIEFIYYENQPYLSRRSFYYMMDDKYLNTFLDIYQDYIHNYTNIAEHKKDMLCNILQKYKVSS